MFNTLEKYEEIAIVTIQNDKEGLLNWGWEEVKLSTLIPISDGR